MRRIIILLTIVGVMVLIAACGGKETPIKETRSKEVNETNQIVTKESPEDWFIIEGTEMQMVHPDRQGEVLLSIPSSVTKIASDAFGGCNNLREVVIPDSVTEMGVSIFSNKPNIEKVSFGTGLTELDKYTFSRSGIKEVTLPKNLKKMGSSTFVECKNLVEIELPDTLENISSSAFQDCSKLKAVRGGAGVKIIEDRAFTGCLELVDFTISPVLESIGLYAFHATQIQEYNLPTSLKFVDGLPFESSIQKIVLKKGSWAEENLADYMLGSEIQRIDVVIED